MSACPSQQLQLLRRLHPQSHASEPPVQDVQLDLSPQTPMALFRASAKQVTCLAAGGSQQHHCSGTRRAPRRSRARSAAGSPLRADRDQGPRRRSCRRQRSRRRRAPRPGPPRQGPVPPGAQGLPGTWRAAGAQGFPRQLGAPPGSQGLPGTRRHPGAPGLPGAGRLPDALPGEALRLRGRPPLHAGCRRPGAAAP